MIKFYKRISETPKEALARLREEFPEYKESKLAYAGRLDPQAYGELLVLIDDECKDRDKYQNLDKIYRFSFLEGYSTDTGDIMGLIKSFSLEEKIDTDIITSFINSYVGKISQPYPIFSSKTVNGVPLWKLAKEGKHVEVEIPSHDVEVFFFESLGSTNLKGDMLLNKIEKRVTGVNGEFRQDEIITKWQEMVNMDLEYNIYEFRIKVSSGTYIRQIAEDFSTNTKIPVTCWEIFREEVII